MSVSANKTEWIEKRIIELVEDYGAIPPPWFMFPDTHPYDISWRMGSGESHLIVFSTWWEQEKRNWDEAQRIEYFRRWPPPPHWLTWMIEVIWDLDPLETDSSEAFDYSPYFARTETLGFGTQTGLRSERKTPVNLRHRLRTMTQPSKPIIYLLLIFALGACLFFGGFVALLTQFYRLDGPTVQEGQERADNLLLALEQYRHDTGQYPSDLNLLVPTYLATLPRPAWRWSYSYELQADGQEFVISLRWAETWMATTANIAARLTSGSVQI